MLQGDSCALEPVATQRIIFVSHTKEGNEMKLPSNHLNCQKCHENFFILLLYKLNWPAKWTKGISYQVMGLTTNCQLEFIKLFLPCSRTCRALITLREENVDMWCVFHLTEVQSTNCISNSSPQRPQRKRTCTLFWCCKYEMDTKKLLKTYHKVPSCSFVPSSE